jgi:hypothetical protein
MVLVSASYSRPCRLRQLLIALVQATYCFPAAPEISVHLSALKVYTNVRH